MSVGRYDPSSGKLENFGPVTDRYPKVYFHGCALRDGVLWLTASSTAQSAKLRQATPRLLSTLGGEAIQVYEIRVRVEPGITGYPEQGSSPPSSTDAAWLRPSSAAADTISKFALTVRESPLKRAAERLAETLRKRSKR